MTSSATLGNSRKPGEAGLAGTMFGIDLMDLFEEDGATKQGFEGFEPSLTIEQQYQGRSPSTMTYKTPFAPPTTAIFSLTPKDTGTSSEAKPTTGSTSSAGSTAPAQEMPSMAAAAAPQQLLDRTLKSFINLGGYGDPTKEVIGAKGIGSAMQYGYSPDQIQAMAKQEGVKFGPDAATSLGLGDMSSYIGSLGQEGFLGQSAVDEARGMGLTDEAIKELAKQQNLQFGPTASRSVGYKPKVSSPTGYSGYQTYSGSDAGSYANPTYASQSPGSVGAAAIDRMAAAQGISQQQAAQQAVAQGYQLGDLARGYL